MLLMKTYLIPGNYTGKSLMNLHFHTAGEASQSWWKERKRKSHLTRMAVNKKKKAYAEKLLLTEP